MIVYRDVIQNTAEWRELRAGIPTSSQFHRILTPKGAESKSAEMYLLELLAERMTGEPIDGYQSTWMWRGHELEEEAVEYYSLQTDEDTEPVGFITDDDGTVGCSPDRLVGPRGLMEIKVPKPAIHVGYLLEVGTAYEEYRIQTQGQLWITEREFVDLLAYNPGLPPALYRVERDEKFIELIRKAVLNFSVRLGEMTEELIRRGWIGGARKEKHHHKTISQIMREALIDIQKPVN